MSEENVDLARRASYAWNEGGVEAILPYLDPEVDWHPPPESVELGSYHGHAGVREYLGRVGEAFDRIRVESVDVMDVDAERVISAIRLIAHDERFGTDIEGEWAWLVKARNGKCVEVWTFTDPAEALEAVGLSRRPTN